MNESPLDYYLTDNPVIWVFGYGSLLWKPDFCYKSKVIGYIDGYERKFNQGNETFRGIPGKPGRVANLEEKTGCKTWGVAYEINGRVEVSKVLQNLYVRESRCGGYNTMITTFFPREYANVNKDDIDSPLDTPEGTPIDTPVGSPSTHVLESANGTAALSHPMAAHLFQSKQPINYDNLPSDDVTGGIPIPSSGISSQFFEAKSTASSSFVEGTTPFISPFDIENDPPRPVQVLLYTVTPENSLYLGSDDTIAYMAHQIVDSKGTAGTNAEYVLKIAEFVRKYIPEDEDEYLFALESKIREELYRRINLQRRQSNVAEMVGQDADLEHHEALLNASIMLSAS